MGSRHGFAGWPFSVVASVGGSFVRWFGPLVTMAGAAALLVMMIAGRIDLTVFDRWTNRASGTVAGSDASMASTGPAGHLGSLPGSLPLGSSDAKSTLTLRIATLPVESVSARLVGDPDLMAALGRAVAQFDVIAIQQIGGGDAAPIERLVDSLRSSGEKYSATISRPVGREPHVDCYAFLWDESRIQLVPQSAYLVPDPADRMRREPMVASFEARVGFAEGRRPFRFTLINADIAGRDAHANAADLDVLDDVYLRVRQYDLQTAGEDDCLLLGNLAVADPSELRQLGQIRGLRAITSEPTADPSDAASRDMILIDSTMTTEFTGRSGVFRLETILGLAPAAAGDRPGRIARWAEWSVYEMPHLEAVAEGQPEVVR